MRIVIVASPKPGRGHRRLAPDGVKGTEQSPCRLHQRTPDLAHLRVSTER
jgi:hypothetical protein